MPAARTARRPALALTAALAALALAATACGPDDADTDAKAGVSASPAAEGGEKDPGLGLPDELPDDLPDSLRDLEGWKKGGWEDWDKDGWLRDAQDFVNPYIEGLWDTGRMQEAEDHHKEVSEEDLASSSARTGTDPAPAAVEASEVDRPYHRHAAPVGKVFMDTPSGPMVCSGTVVKDPNNPGRSNLVATAGHCVHGGGDAGWFRNIMFVPSYNDRGRAPEQVTGAPSHEVAPYKMWWADWAQTTSYWIERGDALRGDAGASQDFAVLHVEPEDGSGKSLEETVGSALPINFDAPGPDELAGLSSYGYPAAPPYDGALMYTCTDRPGRLTVDPEQPAMYRIGCTMTGGTSGGGMYIAGPDGKAELVSVNSIGPRPATWLAGPYLGASAEGVFSAISEKFAGQG
ncbi:trypsin-like serine peptidase [Streptomyces sp. GSL17-111]|uniref:trypsin-like serine peptidase n=1 Tax=Streptomyces sp. GSL17-111 TaxID=3121596 RepID=UPI0030F3D261